MARGGKREGTPGRAYPNRSDLNTAPAGDTYGDKKQMQDRMDAMPLKPAAPPQGQMMQPAAQPMMAPGPLTRPTERPMEPITAGMDSGPGPGPEALGMGPNLEKFRPLLPVLERLADMPETSASTRLFVRRLRGALG